ncbi:MAG: hypothetical protein RJA59_266 [Pseudomonadota bacterium]
MRTAAEMAVIEVRWALARQLRLARHLVVFVRDAAKAAEEAGDPDLARAYEREAYTRREVLSALRAVSSVVQRVTPR